MKLNIRRTLAALLMPVIVAITPGVASSSSSQEPLKVVATFSILADMVKQVGGDEVSVVSLVGPDADAHVFNPSPADAKALAQADVVVMNGLGFEGWIERLIKSSGFKGQLVVASKGVKTLELQAEPDPDHSHAKEGKKDKHQHGHHHDHEGQDPHAWQNLRNGMIYAKNIQQALVKARPQSQAVIDAQAKTYIAQMSELDQQAKAKLRQIPPDDRRILSSHDAFEYFASAYGVKFFGLQGWTTDREASAADMAKLVREIRQDKVRALFVENMSDPRLLQRVAEEAGVKIGGKLYSDSLSPPGSAADTYLKMFSYNVNQIWMALQQ